MQIRISKSATLTIIYLGVISVILEFLFFMRTNSSYHDFQTFTDSAELLASGENPYKDPLFLNSYTLSIPLSKFAMFLPAPIGSTFWNILNAIGIYGFLRIISPSLSNVAQLWVFVLVLASSPARAMFASVQHTGIILGLLTLAVHFARSANIKKRLSYKFLAGMTLIIPFELKPQFALPVMLIFLFSTHYRFSFYVWAGFTVLLHSLMSSYFRLPLDKLWIERLLGRSDITTKVDSGDNSIWILPSYFFGHSHIWLILGFVCYFSALLFQIRLVWIGFDVNSLLVFGMLSTILLPYFHTYDYLIVCTLLSLHYFQEKSSYYRVSAVFLFLVPTIVDDSNLLSRVVFACLIFLVIDTVKNQIVRSRTLWKSFLTYFGTSVVYFISYSRFPFENLRISFLMFTASALFALSVFQRGHIIDRSLSTRYPRPV